MNFADCSNNFALPQCYPLSVPVAHKTSLVKKKRTYLNDKPTTQTVEMAGSKVAAHTLRSQNKAELMKQLEELKQELASLRVQKIAGGASSKVTKIHDVRKNIARVLTVINQSQREAVREHYKGKRTPLDLRVKQTRAIRRKLSKHEATKITEVSICLPLFAILSLVSSTTCLWNI